MKKNITLIYGYKGQDIESLQNAMSEKLSINLTPTQSSYMGEGFSFFGNEERFDYLQASKNYLVNEDSWRSEKNRDCVFMITFRFTKGKNKEKENKSEKIRKLMLEMNNVKELEYRVYEFS